MISGNKKWYLVSGVLLILGAVTFIGWKSGKKAVNKQAAYTLSKDEYTKWLQNNATKIDEVKSSKEFGDIVVTLNYVPAEKRALREAGSSTAPGFEAALDEARKFLTYQLKINHKDGLDVLNTQSEMYRDYESRVKYFSFGIQRKLYLTVGAKRIPCALMHFERTFGLGKELMLNLAFDSKEIPETEESPVLTWEDDFFGIGKINLSIGKNEINTLPQIKS